MEEAVGLALVAFFFGWLAGIATAGAAEARKEREREDRRLQEEWHRQLDEWTKQQQPP